MVAMDLEEEKVAVTVMVMVMVMVKEMIMATGVVEERVVVMVEERTTAMTEGSLVADDCPATRSNHG